MDNCLFCTGEFEELSIKEYSNWDLQLFRDDQYYIGRTAIVFKDRHIVDVTELTKSERDELFDTVIPELQTALEKTFEPDLYNYKSSGNDCRHLHFHIVPRYKEKRSFNGKTFKDEFWNQTHSQDYDRVTLTKSERNQLIKLLQENIPN